MLVNKTIEMTEQAETGMFSSLLPLCISFVENEGNKKVKNKFFDEGGRDKG